MLIPKPWFTKFWLFLSSLSTCGGIGLFLLGGTRSFEEWFGQGRDPIQRYEGFAVFVFILGAAASYALYLIFRRWESVSPTPVAIRAKRKINLAALGVGTILSVLIFALTLSQVQGPMDWDEVARTSELARGNSLSVIHPFTTMNHPIATALSWGTMKLFGVSKVGVRLPALAFTLAFLGLLLVEGSLWLSTFTLALLLCHFASNELVVWYMHSMRGYISLMLFTGAIFFIVTSALKEETFSPKKQLALSLLVGACLFTHTFAAVFCLVFALSLLSWLALNLKNISSGTLDAGVRMLLVFFAWLPILAVVFGFHVAVLDNTGFIHAETHSDHLPAYYALTRSAMVLGAPRVWFVKVLFLASVCLIGWRIRRNSFRDFLTVNVLVSALFIPMALWLLGAVVLEGRMLLAFLLPFLVWVGESLTELPKGRLRTAAYGAVFFWFTVPPLLCAKGLMEGDLQHFRESEQFAAEVQQHLGRVPKRCLTYAGDPDSVHYTRYFYLFNQPELGACPGRYLLFFSKGQFGKVFPLDPVIAGAVHPVYSDNKGRVLYRWGADPADAKIVSR
jgi:hypothetical protein